MKKKPYDFLRTVWKNRLHEFFIIPAVTVMVLDIATTYVGVCGLGGIELNAFILPLAYAVGFLPVAVLMLGIAAGIGLMFCKYVIDREDWMARVFIIAVFAVYIVAHSQIVAANALGLLSGVLQVPVQGQHPQAAAAYAQAFDRAAFCRLIGGI